MTDPTTYDPRYVSVQTIPIEVEDRYETDAKREALFNAERQLELDRNGGMAIPDEEITDAHISAVLNLGTYYLVRGATSNDDVTLGDLDDGGEQTERHAEQYKETYDELIEKLAEAGKHGQSGTYMGATGTEGGAQSVNSGRRYDLRETSDDPLVHEDYRD